MYNTERNNFAGFLVGLALPAGQSLVTGLFLFLFLFPVSSVMWSPDYPGSPFILSLTAGMGVTFTMWIYLRSRWHSALEQLLNIDLNNDGYIGEQDSEDDYYPEAPADPLPREQVVTEEKRVKVFVHEDKQTKIFNVPVDYVTLIKVCNLLLLKKVFNYGDFSGPGKLLSRSEFELLRQELIGRGILVRASGKSSPPSLSRAGKATLEALIAESEGSIPE